MFLKKIAIITVLFFINTFISINPVIANTVQEINFNQSGNVDIGTLCQCETAVYSTTILNNSELKENINLSISGKENQWATLAPENLILNSKQKSTFYIYLTPNCYATPGNYTYNLNATNNFGIKKNLNLNFEVKQCHETNISITPKNAMIPLCEEQNFEIKISNNNNTYNEIADLFTSGIPNEWVTMSETRINIEPNQTKTVNLNIKSDCYAKEKKYKLNLEVALKTEIKKTSIDFTLINTHNLSLVPSDESHQTNVCDTETKSKMITLTNNGTHSDRIKLSHSGAKWVNFETNEVILKSGESKNIPFTITPPVGFIGTTDITLYAKSQLFNVKPTSTQLSINTSKCFDAEIKMTKSTNKTCQKSPAEYTFEIKNTGEKKDTFKFYVLNANLKQSQGTVTIQPHKTTTINIKLDTSNFKLGKNIFTFNAISKNTSKTIAAILETETCYGLNTIINDSNLCPGFENTFSGTITNLGTKTNSYDLKITGVDWITLDKKNILLESNKSEDITFKITPPLTDENKTFPLQLVATSKHKTIKKNFNITLLSKNKCCNSQIKITPEKILVEEGGRGEKILVEIKNTGLMDNTFNLKLNGPTWSYLNPPKLKILNNQTTNVWIYIAPPLNTQQKEFKLYVISNSKCSNTIKNSTVIVRKQGDLLGKLEFNIDKNQTQFEIGTPKNIEIVVKNIGLKKLYNLKAEFNKEFDFNSTTIDVLNPNEQKTILVTLTSKITNIGDFEGQAIVVSDKQILIKYFDYKIIQQKIQITNVSGKLKQTNDNTKIIILEFKLTNTSNTTQTINNITIKSNNVLFDALQNKPFTLDANTTKTINTMIELPNDLNTNFETTITVNSNQKDYLFKDNIKFEKTNINSSTGLFRFMESPTTTGFIVTIILIVSFAIALFLTNGGIQKVKIKKQTKISARQIRNNKQKK